MTRTSGGIFTSARPTFHFSATGQSFILRQIYYIGGSTFCNSLQKTMVRVGFSVSLGFSQGSGQRQ